MLHNNDKIVKHKVSLLNDCVLSSYVAHELSMLRILTDSGTEYCGKAPRHGELF